MQAIDAIYWTCLLLGGGYTLITLLLGGFGHSHTSGQAGQAGAAGHGLHAHSGTVAHPTAAGPAHSGGHGVSHAPHFHVPHVRLPHLHGPHIHAHAHDAAVHQTEGTGEESAVLVHIMSYLNPMAVAGFLLGFGGIGVIARIQHVSAASSMAGGLLGGYALWLTAYLLVSRVFATAGGTSHYLQTDLIGMAGSVTAPIAAGRPGMISCTVAGSRQSIRAALCYGEEIIPVGAAVRIRRLEHGTAYVVSEDRTQVIGNTPS